MVKPYPVFSTNLIWVIQQLIPRFDTLGFANLIGLKFKVGKVHRLIREK